MQLDPKALEAAEAEFYRTQGDMAHAIEVYLQAVQPAPVVTTDKLTAACVALACHGIPTDVQELLIQGDPMRGIPPGAITHALTAALTATASAEPVITDELRGQIAYQLTKRLVIDMLTARACVDDALKGFVHAAPLPAQGGKADE